MKAIAIVCLVLASTPVFAEDNTDAKPKVKTDVKTEVKKTDSVNEVKVERKKVVDRPGAFNDSVETSTSSMGMEKDASGNTTMKSEIKKEVDNPGIAHDHRSVKKTKVVKDSHGKVVDVDRTSESH